MNASIPCTDDGDMDYDFALLAGGLSPEPSDGRTDEQNEFDRSVQRFADFCANVTVEELAEEEVVTPEQIAYLQQCEV